MNSEWMSALYGGLLIGLSASLLLFFNGRVAGISGILKEVVLLRRPLAREAWFFVGGILGGGVLMNWLSPESFQNTVGSDLWTFPLAGFLVGVGTCVGGGCTSGHGVCGISRFSMRSIVATVCFILAGVLSVVLFRRLGVLP